MADPQALGDVLLGRRALPQGYTAETAPSGLKWLYEALKPAADAQYGDVLPFAKDASGVRLAMPNVAREGLMGIADLLAGTETGEVTDRGAASVTMGGLGTGMAMAPRGSLAAGGSIKAYHGSPHDFDRFSFDRIGTGEGAQAYGHGLYFAEKEGVAKGYRDTLAKGYATTDGGTVPLDVQRALEFVHPKYKATGDYEAGLADAISRVKDQAEFYRRTYGPGDNLYDSTARRLQDINPATLKPAGHMYEVAIHADPQRFLDWDKPLSGQSPEVRNVVQQLPDAVRVLRDPLGNPAPQYGEPLGQEIYRKLAIDKVRPEDRRAGFDARSPFEASQYLASSGVSGIRYLDQGSRSAGEGSSNYVVFPTQDEIIEILRKYGMVAPAPVGAPTNQGLADQLMLPNGLRPANQRVY